MKRHTTIVDGQSVAYYTAGTGQKLLFLPPFHSDIERLIPLIRFLAAKFTVYVPELPGLMTRTELRGRQHTSAAYARLIRKLFAGRFRKGKYAMLGLSFGGLIGIRMLEQGFVSPSRFVLYATPINASHITPKRVQYFGWSVIRRVHRSRRVSTWIGRYVMCNPVTMFFILSAYYLGYPRYRETLVHQTKLSAVTHPSAWADVMNELTTLDIPGERLSFSVPAAFVFPRTDSVLNVPETVRSLRHIFPNSRAVFIDGTLHAPAAPMTDEDVAIMVKPLASIL